MKEIKKNPVSGFWLKIGFLSILLLTIFLRFYNYDNRWGLAYDQAHDVLVAREALREHKLPLLGPFSSAGPFQTGGEWYWFIMLGVALDPNSVIAPWLLLTVLSVFFVILMIKVGWLLGGRDLALISGLLSAVSTAQNAQATNLTNQAPLAIIALGTIWASIFYLHTKKKMGIFLLGLFIGLAMSIHLQGVALLPLLILTLVFAGFRDLPVALSGLVIPLLPLLVYDFQHHFVNLQNMFTYYFHNPNPVSYEMLGRRWLTYLTVFWPAEWSLIIGGFLAVGMLTILLVLAMVIFSQIKTKVSKEIWIIILTIASGILLLRYVRTPLFSSYLTFFHPFILLSVSWALAQLAGKKLAVGTLVLLIVLAGSFVKTWDDLTNSTNFTIVQVNRWIADLERVRPAPTYQVYDNKYREVGKSVPLSLLLDVYGKSDPNGLKIGVGNGTRDMTGKLLQKLLVGSPIGLWTIDLSGSTSAELAQNHWYPVDAGSIYRATEEWNN